MLVSEKISPPERGRVLDAENLELFYRRGIKEIVKLPILKDNKGNPIVIGRIYFDNNKAPSKYSFLTESPLCKPSTVDPPGPATLSLDYEDSSFSIWCWRHAWDNHHVNFESQEYWKNILMEYNDSIVKYTRLLIPATKEQIQERIARLNSSANWANSNLEKGLL